LPFANFAANNKLADLVKQSRRPERRFGRKTERFTCKFILRALIQLCQFRERCFIRSSNGFRGYNDAAIIGQSMDKGGKARTGFGSCLAGVFHSRPRLRAKSRWRKRFGTNSRPVELSRNERN
jgi:hypothetical protein